MQVNTFIVDSDKHFVKQVSLIFENLSNYVVKETFDTINDLKEAHNNNLLIITLNIETYESDYLCISKIISSCSDVMVVLIANNVSNEIISKAFTNKFAAIIDKKYFISFCEFILENIYTFRGFYLSPLFVRYLFEQNQNSLKKRSFKISKKQNDVAFFLAKGLSYSEIAKIMNLSINTTRMHIRLLYKKLNVKSRYEMIQILNNGSFNIIPSKLSIIEATIAEAV